MKTSKLLLNGLLVATVLSLTPSRAYSLPPNFQKEMGSLMQKGDFRQAMQMGAMAGTISSFCIIARDGYVHPDEGPVTIDMLNELTSEMLKKARSEFNDYLFSYQKAGLNLGISECNKLLGVQLDYR